MLVNNLTEAGEMGVSCARPVLARKTFNTAVYTLHEKGVQYLNQLNVLTSCNGASIMDTKLLIWFSYILSEHIYMYA